MTTRLGLTCLVEEITPIFLGRYSTSTTRMTLVALGTCTNCSRKSWIETTFDTSTTTLSEHLTSLCTWSLTELQLIVHTPMSYKLVTLRGSMRSNLVSAPSFRLQSPQKILF